MFRRLDCLLFGGLLITAATVIGIAAEPVQPAEPAQRRWVYLQLNLQVRENVAKAESILRRAAAAGYNGIVLADYKLNILDRVPEHYFDNAREFQRVAKELKLEIIPAVASIGYSDGLLAHDPNLAEGMPVRDARLQVRDGVALLQSSLRAPLPGGGFEEHRENLAAGWDFQDSPGRASFIDDEVKHSGKSSLRWDQPGKNAENSGNARVSKRVAVVPWRQYHASVWIKTTQYGAAGNVRLFALSTKEPTTLSHSNLGVRRDQDWTQHHIVFNSLDNTEVRLYCGTWGGRDGSLWMDDLQLEETAFVNLLRRSGCELTVRDAAGQVYEEGRDYVRLEDFRMGRVPYAGSFDVWHKPPVLTLAPRSRIQEGQELRVSFSHTVTVHDNQVCCCLDHPKVFEIIESQVQRVQELYAPQTYFLSHDEIRVANWCGSCRRLGRTAGQLLATNVRQCVAAIRRVNPMAGLCIWSDMFDPYHNAHAGFYLVQGDLAGSWEGLPPDMVVVNWNHDQAAKSLPAFDRRGHQQVLAGYYDHDPQAISDWLRVAPLESGNRGVMYTTWQDNFQHLEAFAKAAWGAR